MKKKQKDKADEILEILERATWRMMLGPILFVVSLFVLGGVLYIAGSFYPQILPFDAIKAVVLGKLMAGSATIAMLVVWFCTRKP